MLLVSTRVCVRMLGPSWPEVFFGVQTVSWRGHKYSGEQLSTSTLVTASRAMQAV